MTDIQLLYPNDKEATACQLRDALNQEGYQVQAIEPVGSSLAPAAGDAKAVVIIWDKSSIWHPAMQAAGDAARDEGRAVDVSADGITPIGLADEAHLVQFSGWSGDQRHPGWQKILAELNRISEQGEGPYEPVRESSDVSASRAENALVRVGDASNLRTRPRLQPWVALGAVVALLLLAGWALSHPGRPLRAAAKSPAVSAAAADRLPVDPAPRPYPQPEPPKAFPNSTLVTLSAPAPETEGRPVPGSTEAKVSVPPNVSAPARKVRLDRADAARSTRQTHHERARPGRPSIRYTKYSKNMRLFCQRSGRATPECRVFRHAFRSSKHYHPA
jgi:hypothetical protein